MPQRIVRNIFSVCAFSIFIATVASGQSRTLLEVPHISAGNTWRTAQLAGPAKGKVFVVTIDQPDRLQTCHIKSFMVNKLVCSRAIGGTHTYLSEQVIALILPGDDALRYKLLFGFNVGLGAAIWGTVVLAVTCPVCAAATALVALFSFAGAGAALVGDGQPNRLLYLAPGQQLSSKLGYVQS